MRAYYLLVGETFFYSQSRCYKYITKITLPTADSRTHGSWRVDTSICMYECKSWFLCVERTLCSHHTNGMQRECQLQIQDNPRSRFHDELKRNGSSTTMYERLLSYREVKSYDHENLSRHRRWGWSFRKPTHQRWRQRQGSRTRMMQNCSGSISCILWVCVIRIFLV